MTFTAQRPDAHLPGVASNSGAQTMCRSYSNRGRGEKVLLSTAQHGGGKGREGTRTATRHPGDEGRRRAVGPDQREAKGERVTRLPWLEEPCTFEPRLQREMWTTFVQAASETVLRSKLQRVKAATTSCTVGSNPSGPTQAKELHTNRVHSVVDIIPYSYIKQAFRANI